jgi:hypothetical protein
MTPTDQMSILESHPKPKMISGARYTPGMTSPVCVSPILAAPKSEMVAGPFVMGIRLDR